jgi:putative protease
VFGAEAQHAAAHFEQWLEAGIRHFRLEFVHESPDQVVRITEAWQSALEGRITAAALTTQLRRTSPQGITEGSLLVLYEPRP